MTSRKYHPRVFIRKKLVKLIELINFKYSKKNAIKVMDKEWDYLIILDSCRYDMITLVLGKKISFVISGGGTTQEWLKWNFNENFYDIVCIAGKHEFSSKNLNKTFGKNPFFKVIDVWDFGYDKYLRTTLPEKVTEATLKALKEYPNKRMIIHYHQPHYPYIADHDFMALENKMRHNFSAEGQLGLWNAIKEGKISLKRLWIAYIKNLKMVLQEVDKLIQELSGKIVISSDHGNLLGEYFRFGHIPFLRFKHLVKVPWFVIKNDEKKEICNNKDN